MTPFETLVPLLAEQYGPGVAALVILYRRIGRVERAVDDLREHVDENAERIEHDARTYPRTCSHSSTVEPTPTPTDD